MFIESYEYQKGYQEGLRDGLLNRVKTLNPQSSDTIVVEYSPNLTIKDCANAHKILSDFFHVIRYWVYVDGLILKRRTKIMVKDYFNHEINIGDIILYNRRSGSRGYNSSFTEGIVVGVDTGRVSIIREGFIEEYNKEDKTYGSYYADRKNGCNTINLTALGIRENQAYKIGG